VMRFEQFIKHRQYLLNVFREYHPLASPRVQMASPGEPDARRFECSSSASAGVRFEADRLQRGSASHQRL